MRHVKLLAHGTYIINIRPITTIIITIITIIIITLLPAHRLRVPYSPWRGCCVCVLVSGL